MSCCSVAGQESYAVRHKLLTYFRSSVGSINERTRADLQIGSVIFDRAVVQVERLRDDIFVAVLCGERKSTMSTIKEIMQIGVGMPDRATFARFSHDMLGFPTTDSPDGNVTYMRVDRYRHRLAARTTRAPVLNYIGFDVGGPAALDEWKTKLASPRHGLALRQQGGMSRTTGG